MSPKQTGLWGIVSKTVVTHTVTYTAVGLLAYSIFDYTTRFADPAYSAFLRQTDHPLVAAGPLLQPIRGLLFGIVFALLREVLFYRDLGWLRMWIMLVFVGIFSTFGPAPGSVEGLIYSKLPVAGQLGGLIEVLTQSLLLSVVVTYWVNHPRRRWLTWLLILLFVVALAMPTLGLLAAMGLLPV
ncbi:MAG: hypothetical protein ACP5HS_13340 [Anaerolineae bacterium]